MLAEIGEFQIRFNETGDSHERVAYASAEHCKLVIKAAPTVKAKLVRSGYWIIRGGDMWCSECGYEDVTENGEPEDYHYCPNCGTEMGGDAE